MNLLISILFLILTPLQAQELESQFIDGINAYEANDFEKAESVFRPLFEQYPNNPIILYNLGLIQYQKGQMGLALGLWRKARFIDSRFTEVKRAIDFTEEQLFPNKEDDPVYITIFKTLSSLPVSVWMLISLFSLLFGGWYALDYGIKRRQPINHWPSWIYLNFPIFLFAGFFTFYLSFQHLSPEATVVEKNLQTHSNPSPEAPTLSELEEGQIVKIEEQLGQWVRIKTDRGTLGWVPKKSVLTFKGF